MLLLFSSLASTLLSPSRRRPATLCPCAPPFLRGTSVRQRSDKAEGELYDKPRTGYFWHRTRVCVRASISNERALGSCTERNARAPFAERGPARQGAWTRGICARRKGCLSMRHQRPPFRSHPCFHPGGKACDSPPTSSCHAPFVIFLSLASVEGRVLWLVQMSMEVAPFPHIRGLLSFRSKLSSFRIYARAGVHLRGHLRA